MFAEINLMSHILVPRRPSPEDGASFRDLRRNVLGTGPTSSKRSPPMLQRARIRSEIAAQLAKRFGYPMEFWLNLGKRRPGPIRGLGPSTPIRNSLILPGDFPRR
jgi:hypothetical protein